jgi:hypothetical protein
MQRWASCPGWGLVISSSNGNHPAIVPPFFDFEWTSLCTSWSAIFQSPGADPKPVFLLSTRIIIVGNLAPPNRRVNLDWTFLKIISWLTYPRWYEMRLWSLLKWRYESGH